MDQKYKVYDLDQLKLENPLTDDLDRHERAAFRACTSMEAVTVRAQQIADKTGATYFEGTFLVLNPHGVRMIFAYTYRHLPDVRMKQTGISR